MRRKIQVHAMMTSSVGIVFASLALAQVDDSTIQIHSVADVQAKRNALVQYIWGTSWPDVLTRQPTATHDAYIPGPDDALPDMGTLPNLGRIEQIVITMSATAATNGNQQITHTSNAYLFHPRVSNGRVVIVHHGHACAFDGSEGHHYNLDKTIHDLLAANYAVVAMRMPLYQTPSECHQYETAPLSNEPPPACGPEALKGEPHDVMFDKQLLIGSPLQFFLEPVARVLNYIQRTYPAYCDFNMVGLSGGAWTTSVYPAIDPRIMLSFHIAGSYPLYLAVNKNGEFTSDCEQHVSTFYRIAGYKDLYVLGSYGAQRRQTQILNNDDVITPNPEKDRAYASDVQTTLSLLGSGTFVLNLDPTTTHQISLGALADVILPTLQVGFREPTVGSCRPAPFTDVFAPLLKWFTW